MNFEALSVRLRACWKRADFFATTAILSCKITTRLTARSTGRESRVPVTAVTKSLPPVAEFEVQNPQAQFAKRDHRPSGSRRMVPLLALESGSVRKETKVQ